MEVSATEELRRMLDERGVKWDYGITGSATTSFSVNGIDLTFTPMRDGLVCSTILTPEQAIAATLGRKPWVNPAWERWHRSLRHDEIKSVGDAVEQLMYEAIEFGGDMGPNGNTYNGIDEGDVLTAGYINEWVERFENMMGAGTCYPIISENLAESGGTGDAWADCSECGQLLFVLTDPSSKPPNYCPNCGAKVVDE